MVYTIIFLCTWFWFGIEALQLQMEESEPEFQGCSGDVANESGDADEQIQMIQSYADAEAERVAQQIIEQHGSVSLALQFVLDEGQTLGGTMDSSVREQFPALTNGGTFGKRAFLESSNLDAGGYVLRIIDVLIARGAILDDTIWESILSQLHAVRLFRHLAVQDHDLKYAAQWTDGNYFESSTMHMYVRDFVHSERPFTAEDRQIVERMVQSGFDINYTDANGNSLVGIVLYPYYSVSFHSRPLAERPDVNGTYAMEDRDFDLLKCLIDRGFDLNRGQLPLVEAAQFGMVSTMRYFIEKGADIKLALTEFDNEIQLINLIRCARQILTEKYHHATAAILTLSSLGMQADVTMQFVSPYLSEVQELIDFLPGAILRLQPSREIECSQNTRLQMFLRELQTSLSGKPSV